jgi:hypothetical protein
MTLQSDKQNGIVINENLKIIVPCEITLICQCRSGFWWGEAGSTQKVPDDNKQAWGSRRILLHEGIEELKPVRTVLMVNWDNNVFIPKKISVDHNDQVILISPIGVHHK